MFVLQSNVLWVSNPSLWTCSFFLSFSYGVCNTLVYSIPVIKDKVQSEMDKTYSAKLLDTVVLFNLYRMVKFARNGKL